MTRTLLEISAKARDTSAAFGIETKTIHYLLDHALNREPIVYIEGEKDPQALGRIENRKVIINSDTGKPLGLVYPDFMPMSNMQAFEIGASVFSLLTGCPPHVYKEKWEARTRCYVVEFIHPERELYLSAKGIHSEDNWVSEEEIIRDDNKRAVVPGALPEERLLDYKDTYLPFVRVTNHLKQGRKFYLEIGYYRKSCSNGLLMGRRTKFCFSHSYHGTPPGAIAQEALDHFIKIKPYLLEPIRRMWQLSWIPVEPADMYLLCVDLFYDDLQTRERWMKQALIQEWQENTERYAYELGNNLLAAFNIATDYASDMFDTTGSLFQQITGRWLQKAWGSGYSWEKQKARAKEREEKLFAVNTNFEIPPDAVWNNDEELF